MLAEDLRTALAARLAAGTVPGPDGCRDFFGAPDKDGYGQIKVMGRQVRAHRAAYFVEHGTWPEPMCLHSCNRPPCVEPSHLRAGTAAENSEDMKAAGRWRGRSGHGPLIRGEHNPNVRLTDSDVEQIRSLYAAGSIRQTDLAARFGVGQAQISRIVRGVQRP